MAFENFDFSTFDRKSGSSRGGSGEKKTYYDESVRSAFVRRNQSAEFRISGKMLRTRGAFVEGPQRKSKAGNVYTPKTNIPCVGHLPGFDGRCAGQHHVKDARISDQFLFEVFDFRWYHEVITEKENYTMVKHQQCLARGPRPNGNACDYCDVESPRILGGWRFLNLSGNRAQQLMMHDTHIMQFPLSDNPVEFFGQKVQTLSASCEKCGDEVFSERRLQMLSPDQVVSEIVRKKHQCPSCGHTGYLKETRVARDSKGEMKEVERGDITCKNVEIKAQPAKRGNNYVFGSDLLPFEDIEQALRRLGVPKEDADEVLGREYSWDKISAPYGIDASSFEDREKYVQVITDKQIRDLNNLYYGYRRDDHRLVNPWFEKKSFGSGSSGGWSRERTSWSSGPSADNSDIPF